MQPDLNDFREDEALRLAQRGNAVALEFLYRRHSPKVYALCLRMVKNAEQAEDLTQETFLAVLRGIRGFRGQAAFATWVHTVARNTTLMSLRKKRIKETSLEQISESDSNTGRLPAEFGMRDGRLEGTVDRMLLQSVIAKLSARLRQALLLHDVQGYEHQEIATMMGCAPGTSKSQVHKARHRIRELLKKYFRKDKRATKSQDGASDQTTGLSAQGHEKARRDGECLAKRDPESRQPPRAVPKWCEPLDADRQ